MWLDWPDPPLQFSLPVLPISGRISPTLFVVPGHAGQGPNTNRVGQVADLILTSSFNVVLND